ncbi:MAG: M28 family peptidase [Gemmatimonadales bacterium]
MRVFLPASVLLVAACAGGAVSSPRPSGEFPGLSAIREADLRSDIDILAGDRFRGREAGTVDELTASMWVAERARAAGLEPAGDDGTFFQFWSLRRTRVSEASVVALDGAPLALGREIVPFTVVNARVEGPIVDVGEAREADLAGRDLKGKVVVATMREPRRPVPAGISVRPFRYVLAAIGEIGQTLLRSGAAAVILVSDATADSAWAFGAAGRMRGNYGIDSTGAGRPVPTAPPLLWATAEAGRRIRRGGTVRVELAAESFTYPSVNVVGRVRGSDPRLRDEYVLFSGHQDHDGVRGAVAGDSIWNGADDNASVSVGMLAIARAFAVRPGRRSALFVWHGAEERGLLGSVWHAAHPVVPRQSIVAVLNADMIGRNAPDSAALLGVQPPHRTSQALADMAFEANRRVGRFVVDTAWDRPSHPEGWYFRSDHAPYARLGIPALFYTTLLHPDYHTPRDEPSRIDAAKLARMAAWMYATGWLVAEAAERPATDPDFRLER